MLHLLAPAAFGGIESVVRLLATGQRRRGQEVLVAPIVADVETRRGWIENVRAAGVPVEPLLVPRRRYVAEWRAVSDLIASRLPAVVHTHGYHADVIAAAARRADRPLVATVHGFIGGDRKNRVYEWLQCRVLRRFDGVVAVSRPMADRLRVAGVAADRLHVVANAFDGERMEPLTRDAARRALGVPLDEFRVGWIGRLSPEKGADVMLRALAVPSARDVHVSIIGDGVERARLASLARELGVTARTAWHGIRPDAARVLPAFDAVVLSSRTEGTPIVLFEAMAACVPIVASRVGGIPDVVSDAEAILVPPEDPVAVARALDAIRTDGTAASARAALARVRLRRHFAAGPWIDRMNDVYLAALARRRIALAS